ncbi:MAG: competence/damage-inducible protein A, partial [Gemmatimonadetes bacterium]|nr:competence/damage-inducible protein A [Gemmatimonadota bacterium]
MKAAVLLIGDELLGGVITDRNVQATARVLGPRGGGIVRVETVGDDPAAIADALHGLAARADVVVVSGGLGPTDDDRTREGVARALGTEVVENTELGRQLGDWLEARGLDRRVASRQASFPGGTQPVRNPVGSAYGFRGRLGDAEFWVLPGVPSEFGEMLTELAATLPQPDGLDWERLVATAGRGETLVA